MNRFDQNNKSKCLLCLILIILLTGTVSVIHAGGVLDQSFTEGTGTLLIYLIGGSPNKVGQIFTAGISGLLSGINIDVGSNSIEPYISTLKVEIFSAHNGLPTDELLGSYLFQRGENVPLSFLIEFQEDIQIQEGEQYAIVCSYLDPIALYPYGGWDGNAEDGYTGGHIVRFESGSWEIANDSDLYFRTYVDPFDYYVSTSGSDTSGDGTKENPWKTIQYAIDSVGEGVTIHVAGGIYTGTGNKNLDFNGKALNLQCETGPEDCIIDCENDGRGFYFHSGEGEDSVVSGFTITNGGGPIEYGGGIYCSNSSPTISNCWIVKNNAVNNGGGIYCRPYSSPRIEDCKINDNSTEWLSGAGIYIAEYSSPTISNSIISGNRCIYDPSHSPQPSGGGIYIYHYSSPKIIGCTITDNFASNGGGALVCVYQCSPIIENCVISNNVSTFRASGILSHMSSPSIINCTITGNVTEGNGGAVYIQADSWPTITNSILWGNVPDEIYMNPNSTPSFPSVTFSDVQGGYGGAGNINVDPLFVSSGDYHLTANSPCRDKGTPEGAPDTDIEGNSRPQGNGYDMGAYEHLLPLDIRKEIIYPGKSDNIIWFIHITDSHIDDNSASTESNNLRWIVNDANNVINPNFIVNTGDLVNGGSAISGFPQQQSQWDNYNSIVESGNTSTYYDLPGNHDRYLDYDWDGESGFDGYQYSSIRGQDSNPFGQFRWEIESPTNSGKFFYALNTCDETGISFAAYNRLNLGESDYPQLSEEEIEALEIDLLSKGNSELSFLFAHHGFYTADAGFLGIPEISWLPGLYDPQGYVITFLNRDYPQLSTSIELDDPTYFSFVGSGRIANFIDPLNIVNPNWWDEFIWNNKNGNELTNIPTSGDDAINYDHNAGNMVATTLADRGIGRLISVMESHKVSAYLFGHTHENHVFFDIDRTRENDPTISSLFINTAGIKDGNYRIVAIDNGGLSTNIAVVDNWPVVLITSPVDIKLGGDNPHYFPVPDCSPDLPNTIRALSFFPPNSSNQEVRFSITRDAIPLVISSGIMTKVYHDQNIYEAEFDLCNAGLSDGEEIKISVIAIYTYPQDQNHSNFHQIISKIVYPSIFVNWDFLPDMVFEPGENYTTSITGLSEGAILRLVWDGKILLTSGQILNGSSSVTFEIPDQAQPGAHYMRVFDEQGNYKDLWVPVIIADDDNDGLSNELENSTCTDPNDADSDDDGIPDGVEDVNHNGERDTGETNPCEQDTDGDGIQDGTELGYTSSDANPDTNLIIFQPDLDPSTTTDPLDDDSDNDGLLDGQEDANHNGRLDPEETDPNRELINAMPWIPLLLFVD